MKRSAPKRKKPLRPSRTPIARRQPARRRGKPRFKGRADEVYREWVREQPCLLVGHPWGHNCWGSVQCCHVKARSTGGSDVGNCVPFCASAHALQHLFGMKSFQRTFKVDLTAIAEKLGLEYGAQTGEAET